MFTLLLLAGGGYLLLKKKPVTAQAPVPGLTTSSGSTVPPTGLPGSTIGKLVQQDNATVVEVPAEEWQAYLDSWTSKRSRSRKVDYSDVTFDDKYPTPTLLGPAQTPITETNLSDDLVPGINNMWLYAGGAAAAYFLFLKKK